MSVINEYWPLVLETLKTKITEANYSAWFSRLDFLGLENQGRKIIISLPSAFNKRYIEDKFKKVFQESINKFYPQVIHIEYRIDTSKNNIEIQSEPEALKLDPKDQEIKNPITKNQPINKNDQVAEYPSYLPPKSINSLNPKYSFDNFVITKNNEMAANVAAGVVHELGSLYNPLFIYSRVGLGKTHLIQSIGNKVLENNPSLNIKYLPAETFVNQFILSIQNRETSKFRDYYKAVDVFLVDDVQFLSGKESTQEQFFHVFNELQQANKQIVLTSDRAPQEIIGIEDRLISRFSMGMVVDISPMDFEDRLAIINDKVKRIPLDLSESQIDLIAKTKLANVREIEGVLNKIKARINFLPNRKFTNEDLEIILYGCELESNPTTRPLQPNNHNQSNLTAEKIVDIVCKLFALQKKDILSSSRQKDISLARQLIFWMYKNELDLSYPVIGKMLGGRDHSTVIYGCKKIEEMAKNDIKMRQKIDLAKKELL